LQRSYDCVDRVVLNAFYPLRQTGGGLRAWWRYLHGDDTTLDDDHPRDMAGTFSRRLRGFCAKLPRSRRGPATASMNWRNLPANPKFCGLFLVIK
jgi:hypothetical protein